MAKNDNLTDFLTDLAQAIRTKKGYPASQKINPQDFASEIMGIGGDWTVSKNTFHLDHDDTISLFFDSESGFAIIHGNFDNTFLTEQDSPRAYLEVNGKTIIEIDADFRYSEFSFVIGIEKDILDQGVTLFGESDANGRFWEGADKGYVSLHYSVDGQPTDTSFYLDVFIARQIK